LRIDLLESASRGEQHGRCVGTMTGGECHLTSQQTRPAVQELVRRSRFRPGQQLKGLVRRSRLVCRLRGGERTTCPAARVDGQRG